MELVYATACLALFAYAFWCGLRSPYKQTAIAATARAGWVYFIGSSNTRQPIRIGHTELHPYKDRLPELETNDPEPLSVIYAMKSNDAQSEEKRIHDDLSDFRTRGSWFDRDAVLAYLDHLKDNF